MLWQVQNILVFLKFQIVSNIHFACFAAFKYWDDIILKPLLINIGI